MSHSDSDLAFLQEQYGDRDWFAGVGTDEYSRCVVYVNYMDKETLAIPPYTEEGRDICVHFVANKTATREQFVEKQGGTGLSVYKPMYDTEIDVSATFLTSDPVEEEIGQVIESKSLQYLQTSLEKLEKDCGSYVLQDLFYEIHDGHNAVTNNSARYPEVRKKLEKLYREYGFDVIYEELDG
jgi:hypothetical protein